MSAGHAVPMSTLTLPDGPGELDKLLTERAMIEREIDCEEMDPIEVVLVFDSQKTGAREKSSEVGIRRDKRKNAFSRDSARPASVNLTPDAENAVTAGDDAVYYDPTKLSFIFSTPSPLRRKYIELRDRRARMDSEEEEDDIGDRRNDDGPKRKRPRFDLTAETSSTTEERFQDRKRKEEEGKGRRLRQRRLRLPHQVYFPASSEQISYRVMPDEPKTLRDVLSFPIDLGGEDGERLRSISSQE